MMYRLTNGDFKQIAYIEENFTVIDLHYWLGISNYINIKDAERRK